VTEAGLPIWILPVGASEARSGQAWDLTPGGAVIQADDRQPVDGDLIVWLRKEEPAIVVLAKVLGPQDTRLHGPRVIRFTGAPEGLADVLQELSRSGPPPG
jgi:hypothetical protein